ncbi:MAG: zinc-binding dehydrogenase, partial [Anaerolineae bacterium]|nr:zinc-binding dehydrogenase [Anaerolineae bacterium]
RQVALGGVDRTYDCVGTDTTLDDALRLTRNGGKVILVAVPGLAKGVDWTAIFAQELTVRAAYIYNHAESWRGEKRATFEIAIELMASGQVDLGWMVTHRFQLDQYDEALKLHGKKGSSGVIKAVFQFP